MSINLEALSNQLGSDVENIAKGGGRGGSANQIPVTPNVYYQDETKDYWVPESGGGHVRMNELSLRRYLRGLGIRKKKHEDELLSPVEAALLKIQRTNHIIYAGPLAGYQKGFYRMAHGNVLVTSSPVFIEPKPGSWPLLTKVLEGLLIDPAMDQRPYFYGWVKIAVESLRAGVRTPGQALVIAGPKGSGKSLLQNLLTPILGGRVANPFQFMTGGTSFNKDCFGAEHLKIEDEASSKDIRTRTHFGIQIKNLTVNETHRCHGKFQNAVSLNPFWRLSITLNDEPEALTVLPPLSDSLEDKLILLKARKVAMPMPTKTPAERRLFWSRLESELPHFLHFLAEWAIPTELRSERFGICEYHHPEIVHQLNELAPEYRLLTFIDHTLFENPTDEPYTGLAAHLEKRLTEDGAPFAHEARKLLTGSNTCGYFLGRLAVKLPTRVRSKRIKGSTVWTVQPPADFIEEEVNGRTHREYPEDRDPLKKSKSKTNPKVPDEEEVPDGSKRYGSGPWISPPNPDENYQPKASKDEIKD